MRGRRNHGLPPQRSIGNRERGPRQWKLIQINATALLYPVRTTTIVCPYAPGGATDILARMLARGLEERLGKSFVVENRPGAGTVLAAHIVAKAQPDGYTLLMGTSTP